jgi:hypothetical protein
MFKDILKHTIKDITPSEYLQKAKKFASKNGYDPKAIEFSDKTKYKLMYVLENKNIYFGNSEYKDFIIYKTLEDKGLIDVGVSKKRRENYLKRATNIKGKWQDNKYSKNNLSIYILWNG